MAERKDVVPNTDAALVQHVRRLGAILIGKTNCPPGGAGLFTDNDVYGRTNNPYDLSRTPGGSSGGEAAAVATGMSVFGFGTDSGGSVRVPAHFCGVAAILPTARVLPLSGVLDDDGPIGPISDPRTRAGIMARSVLDLALLLRNLLPVSSVEEPPPPFSVGDPTRVAVTGLRVALQLDNRIATPSEDTTATLLAAAGALDARGAVIVERMPPPGGHELTHDVGARMGERCRRGSFIQSCDVGTSTAATLGVSSGRSTSS
jgi:amidase